MRAYQLKIVLKDIKPTTGEIIDDLVKQGLLIKGESQMRQLIKSISNVN